MARIVSRGIFVAGWIALAGAISVALAVGGGYVRISQPKPGDELSGKVTVRAQAYGIKDLAYVIFGIDADKPHSTNAEPYRYELDTTTLADGPHTLYAEAHGRYGLLATSAPVQVIVSNQPSVKPRALVQASDSKLQPEAAVRADSRKPAPASAKPATPSAAPDQKPASSPPETIVPLPRLATVAAGSPAPQSDKSTTKPASALAAAASGEPKIPAITSPNPEAAAPSPRPAVPSSKAPAPKSDPVASQSRAVTLEPLMKSDRAFVRFRSMAEGLGYTVTWLHDEKKAVAGDAKSTIEVTTDSAAAVANGQPFEMADAAYLHEDRLVAPGRSCAGMLGAQIAWDASARTVRISLNPERPREMAAR